MENKPKHLSYAAIILLAFLNAVLLFPFLYYYLGGLILGNSGGKLLLYVFPVAVFGVTVPLFAVYFALIESLVFGLLIWLLFRKGAGKGLKGFLAIYLVLLAAQALSQTAPVYYMRHKAEKRDPVELGTVPVDLSGAAPFNTRDSMKSPRSLQIKGDTILWNEHTKTCPPYDANVWEFFLLTVDTAAGRGSVRNAAGGEEALWSAPKSSGVACTPAQIENHIKDPFTRDTGSLNCKLIAATGEYVAISYLTAYAGGKKGTYQISVDRLSDGRTVYKKGLGEQITNIHWSGGYHSGKIAGDTLYYGPDNDKPKAVIKVDLVTGQEKTILETALEIKDWDADGNLIVYSVDTGKDPQGYNSYLYLKKFEE